MSTSPVIQPITTFDSVKPFYLYDKNYTKNEPKPNDKKYLTEKVYWKEYYQHFDTVYEWNDGHLEEKGMSSRRTYIIHTWLRKTLEHYLHAHPENEMYDLNFGFRLNLGHKNTVRIPDVGIVSQHNPVQMQDDDNSYKGIYDICIEAVSNSNKKQIERDVIHKKKEYALAGVQEYYTIHEESRYTQFYQLQGNRYIPMPRKNGIIKSNVLLGFQFRIADLHRQPNEDEMINDSVYKKYVALSRQKEKQKADNNLREVVLRTFNMIGKNLETISIISGLKKEIVESILKQAGKL